MEKAEISFRRVRILGVPVDCVNMSDCIGYLDVLIAEGRRENYVLAVNPEKVMALHNNAALRLLFEKAALLIPDGIGAVLAMRLLHGVRVQRVAGVDLMLRICARAATKHYRVFVYGAKEEVNKEAVAKLNELYPGISIVGRSHGYVPDEEMETLVDSINRSQADILFVALGSPKQEHWIAAHLPGLNVKVCQGIGGTLDAVVGNVKRAPSFFQRAGLEWLYRLVKEPSRIRRQMVLPVFALKVLTQSVRRQLN